METNQNINSEPDISDLIDPDSDVCDKEAAIDLQIRQGVLSQIVHDKEVCEYAFRRLKPSVFVDFGSMTIARVAFDYFDKCKDVIPRKIALYEVEQIVKERKDKAAILSKFAQVFGDEYHEPSRQYYFDKIREFASHALIKKAYSDLLAKKDYMSFYKLIREAETIDGENLQAVADEWLSDEDCENFKEPVWLVKDQIELGSLCCAYGSSGSGKTFWGLDLAFCCATGKALFGEFPVQQCSVAYICSEGGQSGYKIRRDAWKSHHGISKMPNYVFSLSRYNLTDPKEVEKIAAQMHKSLGKMPELIVVDTLSCNYGGGDVDKNQDMKAFMAGIDLLRRLTGATVVIVHHTGWSDKERETGAKTLRNCIDTSILISRENDLVSVKQIKQRNAPVLPAYVLRSLPVGRSAVLEYDATALEQKNAEKVYKQKTKADEVYDLLPVTDDYTKGITVQAIADKLVISPRTVERRLKVLITSSMITRDRAKPSPSMLNPTWYYYRSAVLG